MKIRVDGQIVQEVTPNLPKEEQLVHASTWFKANKGMKPSFVVKTSGNSKENVARLISDSLLSGNTPLPLLGEYLYHASESFSAKNGKEAWTSYGVIIVPAGETYNPLDIADFDAEEEGADIGSSNRTPYEDKVLLAGALGLVRYSLANQMNNYRTTVWNRIQAVVTSFQGSTFTTPNKAPDYSADPAIMAMASCYDMFFHRNPGHEAVSALVGSLVLRYKDCATWTSLVGAAKECSLSIEDTMEWILYPAATEEAARMFQGGDEYNIQHSYFPYATSLGLVRRSYFSASAAPNLYNFLHCAGCLRQSYQVH